MKCEQCVLLGFKVCPNPKAAIEEAKAQLTLIPGHVHPTRYPKAAK